jgi:hypothetical protein
VLNVNGVVRGAVQTLLPNPLTSPINRPPRGIRCEMTVTSS